MVEANSQEEVVEWAKKCPAVEGDTLEIRRILDWEDFGIKQ